MLGCRDFIFVVRLRKALAYHPTPGCVSIGSSKPSVCCTTRTCRSHLSRRSLVIPRKPHSPPHSENSPVNRRAIGGGGYDNRNTSSRTPIALAQMQRRS